MDIITKLNPIMNNVKEYIGVYQTAENDYEPILSATVGKYSANVYKDPKQLNDAMREFGATEAQATKVYLMTLVKGFREILEIDGRIQQVDIDRYIQNAVRETAFNITQILELTSAIFASLGIDSLSDSSKVLDSENGRCGFVVPMSVYEEELKVVERKIAQTGVESLIPNELARLETLAMAGIPRAKFYLGYCLLKNDEFEKNSLLGLRYLEEAAAEGDSYAAGALGDYYYEQGDSDSWSQAFSYYTGNGALALNKTRKFRIADILNYRKFNFTTIAASILLALAMLATVIIAPANTMFAAHRVWGCILFILVVVIVVVSILHHRQKPYDNLLWVPSSIFIIWTLYFLIRIIF